MTGAPSPRTAVKRMAERGVYDPQTIHAIVDEALYCHVGFAVRGQPYVIPTVHARVADTLYLHGSPASRMLKVLRDGVPICVTITLLDGLVLARSAFHHSMNYRSVVVLGVAHEVTDAEEKITAFKALVDHIAPGRWAEIRGPSNGEFARTQVLSVGLDEASAKVRTGPPIDDENDHSIPVWAGVVPVETSFGRPIDDPRLGAGRPPPALG